MVAMKMNRSTCLRACLVILICPFVPSASTQWQAQKLQAPLQATGTEASEYLAEANLAFSDLPEPNFIDAGPPSVAFPDIPESNSIDPGPSFPEVGQAGIDAYVAPPLAAKGSFLQLPPPSSFLHLKPLDPHALSGPQERVKDGSALSVPSPLPPATLLPSTAAELPGVAARDAQSLSDREEGQRQRLGIELLFGMQKELTKLSREVDTLAARSTNSHPSADSGLHLVRSGGGDSQTTDDRKTSSGEWPYRPSEAAYDAYEQSTMWSKFGLWFPIGLQIVIVACIAICVLRHWTFADLINYGVHKVACGALSFMLFLNLVWAVVCLSGLMDRNVKQAFVVSMCAMLVVCNIGVILAVVWHAVRRYKCVQAVANVPDDIKAMKGVVTQVLHKMEAVYGAVGDGIDDMVEFFDADYDSSTEGEKKDDPATMHSGVAIRVTIVQATGLRNTSWLATDSANAYCSCAVARRRKLTFKTKSVPGTVKPVWNHRHVIKDVRPDDVLKFKVWDHKDLLGKAGDRLGDGKEKTQDYAIADLQRLPCGARPDPELSDCIKLALTDPSDPTNTNKPELIVRIERATEQHIENAEKFGRLGL